MIKFFHQLSREDFNALRKEMTWAECAQEYSQPVWCDYPLAVRGLMGCCSLMGFEVTGRSFCRDCDYYKAKKAKLEGK